MSQRPRGERKRNRKVVMDDNIDPKIVMDLSTFKIGGCNCSQPSNQNLLEEFIE